MTAQNYTHFITNPGSFPKYLDGATQFNALGSAYLNGFYVDQGLWNIVIFNPSPGASIQLSYEIIFDDSSNSQGIYPSMW